MSLMHRGAPWYLPMHSRGGRGPLIRHDPSLGNRYASAADLNDWRVIGEDGPAEGGDDDWEEI